MNQSKRTLRLMLLSGIFCTLASYTDASDKAAFWQAARDGDVDEVKRLLEAGVDVDTVTEFNCGAMYFAANKNHAGVIRILVAAGGDVNLRDTDYKFTPVQMAAWLGHTEAVKALIDGGATESDVVGSCFAAASNGHAATVELIVQEIEFSQGQLNALWSTANSTGRQSVCTVLERLGARPKKPNIETDSGTSAREETTAADSGDAPCEDAKPAFDFSADQPMPVLEVANWPEFRGPDRSGIADGQHPPIAFDRSQERNVLWTRPVEGLGLSSPIIWDGRLYITTAVSDATEQTIVDGGRGWIDAVEEAVPHAWKVLCLDLNTGELIWERTAVSGLPRSRRHWKASQANPTCATDGQHLIAWFGSQGLFCFNLEGNLLWEKDFGILDSGWYIDSTFEWGFASSPIIFGGKVIIQCDVHGDSFVAALSVKDGRELWRTPREEIPSWGTPTVHRGAQNELILNASKMICAYDPDDGQSLWQIRGNSPITVASPIVAEDLIVTTGGYKTPKPIYVVRPGARGDITPSSDAATTEQDVSEADNASIVWSRQTGGVYIVTPLLYRGMLYLCKQNGVLSCYDAEGGDRLFQKRLECGPITASPVAADGRIYCVGENGKVVILQAGSDYQQLAVAELGEDTLATPAISNGIIVFRTVKGLIAVGHTSRGI